MLKQLLLPLLCFTVSANAYNTSDNQATQKNYQAVKWYRNSAERNANYIQTYKLAEEKILAKASKLKPHSWGVILDIDETILDNSQYSYQNVINHTPYSTVSNYAFMESATSVAIPGSVKFTCDIQKHNGYVVLVTNRNAKYKNSIIAATKRNLEKEGICFDTIIFSNDSSTAGNNSDKTPRFNAVKTGNYDGIILTKKIPAIKVLAYLGDNIQDFPNILQKEAYQESNNLSYHDKFGEEYFILPNPVYGSFDKNIFQ